MQHDTSLKAESQYPQPNGQHNAEVDTESNVVLQEQGLCHGCLFFLQPRTIW